VSVLRRLTWIVLILATATAAAVGPSRALADADPASDVLLGSLAFYPYDPAPSQQLQTQLNRELAQLHQEGLGLKVAIVETPIDLGAIPNMFGKPQTYADFLEQEISFGGPVPLLVVMPAGFGLAHAGSPASLAGLKVDAAQRSDGLTESAILAARRIAQTAGKSAPTGATTSPSDSGTSPVIKYALPAILVLLAAFIAARVQRRGARTQQRRRAPARGSSARKQRQ
jgi:hypothetical protein